MNKLSILLVVFVGILGSQTAVRAARRPQNANAPAADAAAIKQFNGAIAQYIVLRNKLRTEVTGPVANSSAAQINNAADALAGAIERSRQGARPGAIMGEPVAIVIKRRIADTVRAEHLESVLAKIDDDAKAGPTPKVHLRLPVSEQMATMPPSLLKVLPVLPKELEYRILGRYLVIRDVDASLVLDFIPAAVPR